LSSGCPRQEQKAKLVCTLGFFKVFYNVYVYVKAVMAARSARAAAARASQLAAALATDRAYARRIRDVYADVAPLDALQLAHALRVMGKVPPGTDASAAARAFLSDVYRVEVDAADFAVRAQTFRGRWARVFALWSAANTVHAPAHRQPHDVIAADDAVICQEYVAFNDELDMVARAPDALAFLLSKADPVSFNNAPVTHIRRVSWDPSGDNCDDVVHVDALPLRLYALADVAAPLAPPLVIELEGGRRASPKKTKSRSRSRSRPSPSPSPRRLRSASQRSPAPRSPTITAKTPKSPRKRQGRR